LTACLTVLTSTWRGPWAPPAAIAQSPVDQVLVSSGLAAQARTLYEAGDYGAAAALFEQAAAATRDPLQQAALWANAALAYQRTEDWAAATVAIDQARALVIPVPSDTVEVLAIAAQVQDVYAQLLFSQGKMETASITWESAAIAYEQSDQPFPAWQAQLNQAQALQAAGFYRRSVDLLNELVEMLAGQPPSDLTVRTYRSLGEALRLTGELEAAEKSLQQSLQLAQQLALPDEVSLAYRRLGDLARLQGDPKRNQIAQDYYGAAQDEALSPLVKYQAQLAKLRLWTETEQWPLAYEQGLLLWEERESLPSGRNSLYAQIELMELLQTIRQAIATTLSDQNPVPETAWYTFVQRVFATDLNSLRQTTTSTTSRSRQDNPLWYVIDKHFPPLAEMASQLLELRQQAQDLGDVQAEASLLRILGGFYTQVEDWETAAQLTREGLVLAQSYNLGQVAYGLQAQLGQIELAQGDREGAIAAYQASVKTLQTLREDVVAVSSEAQYSFQQSIEPIYRELATLLLTEESAAGSTENLKQAREVIELLQLAELDNFFREACLSGDAVEIDQLDAQAAVLYPILLPDRLDVVVSLPDQTYQNFSTPVDPDLLTQTINLLQTAISSPFSDAVTARGLGVQVLEGTARRPPRELQVLPLAAQLYDWLIRPAESALANSGAKTLVFVLDGGLRSIPMSVLYDGQQYLMEKYAIALTPGLRLVDPQPLPKENLSVILAGLSEQGQSPEAETFSPLPFVREEVDIINQYFPSTVMLNADFNVENFTVQVGSLPSPVVHLATHGKFGSTLEETFVLTWDETLKADRFSDLLLASELSRENPVELLVLSACETARGDELAALGLAGIAIRSGARSTLASLWNVSDRATAQLMGEFYQRLSDPNLTKAEAIRQAQLSLLNQPDYQHPYYWSAFVLLGNWL
jgi:CHAT domain-containing protein/tetratricopeptide (TPR) repeat protein